MPYAIVTRLNRSMFSNVARPGSELPGPPRTARPMLLAGTGGGDGFTDAASKVNGILAAGYGWPRIVDGNSKPTAIVAVSAIPCAMYFDSACGLSQFALGLCAESTTK
jgi:hypothetical protein